MTILGWVVFGIIAASVMLIGSLGVVACDSIGGKIASGAIALLVTAAILWGMLWFYANTATGKRAMVSQKSELNNGMMRTVTIFTANGDVIAQYTGEIDIQGNDGGYVLFDFEGKRYTYYNCFVESIAVIE